MIRTLRTSDHNTAMPEENLLRNDLEHYAVQYKEQSFAPTIPKKNQLNSDTHIQSISLNSHSVFT